MSVSVTKSETFTIEQLEQMLVEAKSARRAKISALKESVQPVYQFTIAPNPKSHYELHDSACVIYRLSATIVNADECSAVGHDVKCGGMDYLFNRATGTFVLSLGGGHIYLPSGRWSSGRESRAERTAKEEAALGELAQYVRDFPEGGIVSGIVNHYSPQYSIR